jgi:WD40 repeat protein
MEIDKAARGSTNWLAVAVLALATFCIRVEHAHAQATVLQHQGAVRRIAFSPDGEVLATASDDWTAKLWDVETGALISQNQTTAPSSLSYAQVGSPRASIMWSVLIPSSRSAGLSPAHPNPFCGIARRWYTETVTITRWFLSRATQPAWIA